GSKSGSSARNSAMNATLIHRFVGSVGGKAGEIGRQKQPHRSAQMGPISRKDHPLCFYLANMAPGWSGPPLDLSGNSPLGLLSNFLSYLGPHNARTGF